MSPAEFKALFPQFATTDNTRIQFFLDMGTSSFDQCRWGGFYVQGFGYWVAHQLTLADEIAASGGSGVAEDYSQERVGDLSISRDSNLSSKKSENPFLRTIYGQQYLYYLRLVGKGAVAV